MGVCSKAVFSATTRLYPLLRRPSNASYLPENKEEVVLARVGGLGMTVSKDGKSSNKYEKLVTVFFRRVLQEVRVQGPGSRILVHLGEQAALVGVIRNWPDVKAQEVSGG